MTATNEAEVEVTADLEALAVVSVDATAAETVAAVRGALRRQLAAVAGAAAGSAVDVDVLSPCFLPPGWAVPITPTVAVPADAEDPDVLLRSWRSNMHRMLGLALDRPVLRLAQAISWDSQEAAALGGRLHDVHREVEASSKRVAGGTRHEVSGSYDYFHYLQVRYAVFLVAGRCFGEIRSLCWRHLYGPLLSEADVCKAPNCETGHQLRLYQ